MEVALRLCVVVHGGPTGIINVSCLTVLFSWSTSRTSRGPLLPSHRTSESSEIVSDTCENVVERNKREKGNVGMLGIFCGLGGAEENAKGGNVFGPVQQCHVAVASAITVIAVRVFRGMPSASLVHSFPSSGLEMCTSVALLICSTFVLNRGIFYATLGAIVDFM